MKKLSIVTAVILFCITTMSFVVNDDWFLLETKNCKMYFPQKPTEQVQTLNTAAGDLKIDIYMYEVPDSVYDNNLVYCMIETDNPEGVISSDDKKSAVDAYFRGAVDGAVKNLNGKIITESAIELDGYPGREVKIDYQEGVAVIKMRFYLVKTKMFGLQTITETKNDANKSIDRFMDSFTIKK